MRRIEVTLLRGELIYDIELVAHVVGETVRSEDERDRSIVMDVADDGKVDKTTLNINKAWCDLLNETTGYTKVVVDDDMASDNSFIAPEEYVVVLTVPESFTKLNVEAIKNAMHAYVVNKALEGWFSMTKKDEVAYYANEARMELAKVKRFLNMRIRPTRIRLSPF